MLTAELYLLLSQLGHIVDLVYIFRTLCQQPSGSRDLSQLLRPWDNIKPNKKLGVLDYNEFGI